MLSLRTVISCLLLLLTSAVPRAAGAVTQGSHLEQLITREISRKYPAARVELIGPVRWTRGAQPQPVAAVQVLSENAKGEAQILARGENGVTAEGWISYSAWVSARVAIKRVRPGEVLRPESFTMQEVNLAAGRGFDFRGLILDAQESELGGFEARQTILEGQFLTQSAVQRVPDIRKGDTVRIEVDTGGLVITTTGIADEPARLNGPLRVITSKTKRTLTGQLTSGNVVEVHL